jgi:pilus assembly protein Flp/PilA
MIKMLKNLHKEESGQDLIEYALLAALIAVALIASMSAVASGISSEFSQVVAQL